MSIKKERNITSANTNNQTYVREETIYTFFFVIIYNQVLYQITNLTRRNPFSFSLCQKQAFSMINFKENILRVTNLIENKMIFSKINFFFFLEK